MSRKTSHGHNRRKRCSNLNRPPFANRWPRTAIPFAEGDVYVFGRESVGLPRALTEARGSWLIPMIGATRSLNLSNAAAVVSYAALQHIRPGLFA